ncbi:inositol polyphosphate kinase [Kipferlia bialata]|uniref:Kinase n=1 Tax=Kipferlia bialata TaxID=797122 RepID=A0A9K3CYB4_9EUKA|nr:inositol polyphosphate kinase [Kipferlia bialata]|eukprot:g6062.t1
MDGSLVQVSGHLDLHHSPLRAGVVLKPLISLEHLFYTHAPPQLLPFIPRFEGVTDSFGNPVCAPVHSDTVRCVRHPSYRVALQDLTHGMNCPCVTDIKLGRRTWGLDAAPSKIASHTAKRDASLSSDIGLRSCGYVITERSVRSGIETVVMLAVDSPGLELRRSPSGETN